jgi:phasin family protein
MNANPINPVRPVPSTAEAVADATASPTQVKGINTMINKTEDLVAFGKDNLEAITTSGKIWVAGVQDLTKQFAATAKASMEESVATMKALASVRSFDEAVKLQAVYGQAVTKALTESNRLTDASLKLTEQALAPLTARVAAAVGAMSKAA